MVLAVYRRVGVWMRGWREGRLTGPKDDAEDEDRVEWYVAHLS